VEQGSNHLQIDAFAPLRGKAGKESGNPDEGNHPVSGDSGVFWRFIRKSPGQAATGTNTAKAMGSEGGAEGCGQA